SRASLEERHDPLKYPQNFPEYRYYGNSIKTMIDVANTWADGELKEALIITIANRMETRFLDWNKETEKDNVIYRHSYQLPDGKINLQNSEEDLSDATSLMRTKTKFATTNNKKNGGTHHKKSNLNNRPRKRY